MSHGQRVLFVSPNLSELFVFSRLLRDISFEVDSVRHTSEASGRIRGRQYAAIIFDEDEPQAGWCADLIDEAFIEVPSTLLILIGYAGRPDPLDERYVFLPRPFVAQPLVQLLEAHRASAAVAKPQRSDDTQPFHFAERNS